MVVVSVEYGKRKPYFIRSTATEQIIEVVAEPQPQSALTDTVQTATPEAKAEITAEDIETTLLDWNGDEDSKARVLAYMQAHSRERGTADLLKNEYGGNLPAFTVTKGDLSLELPWAKVQRILGQLVLQDRFFVTDAAERYTVEQTSDAWEQPFIVRDNTIPDSDKDRYHHTEDSYLTYDTEKQAQTAADRLNGAMPRTEETIQHNPAELTFEMYDTGNPDIFKVKENSYLVSTEINATQELWERFAGKGLTPKEDSEQRIVFETDGKDWNRFYIPDTYGNKCDNINALDVLTPMKSKPCMRLFKMYSLPRENRQKLPPFLTPKAIPSILKTVRLF